MKNVKLGRLGFTLIELLVVVLIIGILAAIALPQYQRAVEKSRAVQALTAMRSLIQAEESYFLANGEYTLNLSQLDISLPELRDWSFTGQLSGRADPQFFMQRKGKKLYFLYYTNTKQFLCQAKASNVEGQKICESFPTKKRDCYGEDLGAGNLCYYFD